MGSMSSGNHGGKACTADMHALDVRKMQREGLLSKGRSFDMNWTRSGEHIASVSICVDAGSVTLDYSSRPIGEERQAMNYQVPLARTACHYGGQRVWWLCPALGCGRRVAVLYGGSVFACRNCHKLAYKSQRESPQYRTIRRADKLRERLGWQAGIVNQAGGKPKGMHWQTFWKMHASHDDHVRQALGGVWAKLGKTVSTLEHINQVTDDL